MKARMVYLAAAVVVIVLGLGSRKFPDSLPEFISSNAGDALWAIMIYLGVRAIGINKSRGFAAGVSLIFCFAIEFSQLYQADWINSIRSTLLGALVLGKGFLFVDLVRYTVGIMIAFVVDRSIHRGVR
ncbi:hypothetical protein Back11_41750 [Paenibacillus baekrokdamisoli]|uniref:Uncharacterized protein n=2 Tax=Paenibacillus baekrokdamisoli TaxID=1712516 RepID=A0A3G9IVI8_9BACL|nr:DUF2809 domain-containing protein [Paenibacillus baekrokdamisoli]MBB3068126.1 hypothetical protein [Paenibacillus baekrokdamisoli]BBH22830.1 hypothetical protein Back11_41750 [Paenibacillus baekrokdamisoli]